MFHSENHNESFSSHLLFHVVGYGLLLFVFFDVADIFFPPRLMNPIWEFQTIGALIERVPLPLIGMVLVFYGGESNRSKWEKFILNLLSQAAIIIGVLFLLLIPLCISDAIRINNMNAEEINTQVNKGVAQIQQFEQQLNKATEQDLVNLMARLNSQSGSPKIENSQELKTRLLADAQTSQTNMKTQADATLKNKGLNLMKNTVKWCIGALIAGDLFIRIWQATRWARGGKKRKLKAY
ncbi:MAG TPA: hypothetical protein DEV81_20335 [Cyanobacteria bacterium UBA11049]|nr:hypothetical protein [Cyanobacteria bacterium UBA11049]